jgi:hypothetical protein
MTTCETPRDVVGGLVIVGIGGLFLLFGRELPPSMGAWVPLVSALFALAAYGVPTEIFRVLVQRNPELSAPFLLRALQPLELVVSPLAAPLVWIGRLVAGTTDAQRSSTATAGVTETEVEIIVNEGEASASDIETLIDQVRTEVEKRHGRRLVPECRVVGEA